MVGFVIVMSCCSSCSKQREKWSLRRDSSAGSLVTRDRAELTTGVASIYLNIAIHTSASRIQMSGLVGYTSSDEEDDIQPERPAKVRRQVPPAEKGGYLLTMTRHLR